MPSETLFLILGQFAHILWNKEAINIKFYNDNYTFKMEVIYSSSTTVIF
jgi:hypothetical protein